MNDMTVGVEIGAQKFQVEIMALRRGLEKVAGAVGKKEDPEPFHHIRCEVNRKGLFMTAANGSAVARVYVPLCPDFKGNPFQFFIYARELMALAKTAKSGGVEFSVSIDSSGQAKASALIVRDGVNAGHWHTRVLVEDRPQFHISAADDSGIQIKREDFLEALKRCLPFVKAKMDGKATGVGPGSNGGREATTYGLHFRNTSVEAGEAGCFCVANLRLGRGEEATPLFPDITIAPAAALLLTEVAKRSGVEYLSLRYDESAQTVLARIGDDQLGFLVVDVLWVNLVEKLLKPATASGQAIFCADKKSLLDWIKKAGVYGSDITLTRRGNAIELRTDDGNGRYSEHPLPVSWKIRGDYRVTIALTALGRMVSAAGATVTVFEGASLNGRMMLFFDEKVFQAYCGTRAKVSKPAQDVGENAAAAVAPPVAESSATNPKMGEISYEH